jgi:hypothetical protein
MGNYIDACALYRRAMWEWVGGYDEKMRMGWEDWDFWMRAALRGWRFVHLDDIAFDYRVRTGSMLSDTNRRKPELAKYIFGKPGNEILRALRDQGEQLEELAWMSRRLEYRVCSTILAPLRRMKRTLSDRLAAV